MCCLCIRQHHTFQNSKSLVFGTYTVYFFPRLTIFSRRCLKSTLKHVKCFRRVGYSIPRCVSTIDLDSQKLSSSAEKARISGIWSPVIVKRAERQSLNVVTDQFVFFRVFLFSVELSKTRQVNIINKMITATHRHARPYLLFVRRSKSTKQSDSMSAGRTSRLLETTLCSQTKFLHSVSFAICSLACKTVISSVVVAHPNQANLRT